MKEGFDVGLEMSGNAQAFRDMLANMCHGGKIALLGILPHDTPIDWDTVIFNSLTIKGIYGREMYETWYKMTVMIQGGLDITPGHHAPLPLHRVREGLRGRCARASRARWFFPGRAEDITARFARGAEAAETIGLSEPP